MLKVKIISFCKRKKKHLFDEDGRNILFLLYSTGETFYILHRISFLLEPLIKRRLDHKQHNIENSFKEVILHFA